MRRRLRYRVARILRKVAKRIDPSSGVLNL